MYCSFNPRHKQCLLHSPPYPYPWPLERRTACSPLQSAWQALHCASQQRADGPKPIRADPNPTTSSSCPVHRETRCDLALALIITSPRRREAPRPSRGSTTMRRKEGARFLKLPKTRSVTMLKTTQAGATPCERMRTNALEQAFVITQF